MDAVDNLEVQKYSFISLVGKQILATLNGLLFIKSNKIDVSTLHVLCTNEVQNEIAGIKEFCEKESMNLEVHKISTMLSSDVKNNEDSAEEIAEIISAIHNDEGDKILYNINGGLNYLNIAVLLKIIQFNPVLFQVVNDGVITTDTLNSESYYHVIKELLSPNDILEKQGISFNSYQNNKDTFGKWCVQNKIKLPDNILKNAEINGVKFDFIWNKDNNILSFLVDARNEFLPESNAAKLAKIRKIISFAQTKDLMNNLFDRDIFVVVDDINMRDHLQQEGGEKIKIIFVSKYREKVEKLKKELVTYFAPTKIHTQQRIIPKNKKQEQVQDDTLVISVGTDPNSTLISLFTHKPKNLILYCTQDLQQISEQIRTIALNSGVETVKILYCNVSGFDICDNIINNDESKNVSVNISPGTKGQGTHLAIWAIKNHASIWAIEPKKEICQRIDSGHGEIDLVIPSCTDILKCKCLDIKYNTIDDLDNSTISKFNSLLGFLSSVAKDINIKCFVEDVVVNDNYLKKENDKYVLRYNGKYYKFATNKGKWFEQFTAYAFKKAGAKDVSIGTSVKYSEESKRAILDRRNIHGDIHLREMDVLGTIGSSNFLVSCKLGDAKKVNPIEEAKQMASIVGRFTITFFCKLICNESTLNTNYGKVPIRVIGWRDLCCPEKLKEYAKELRKLIA